jgi:hypothetical protein
VAKRTGEERFWAKVNEEKSLNWPTRGDIGAPDGIGGMKR